MAATELERTIVNGTLEAIAARGTTSTAPSSSTDGFDTGRFARVRTLLKYTATVDALNVQIWFRDRQTGIWYRGADTDSFDELAPGGASVINESRDWEVGRKQEIYFTFQAITVTGGTAALILQPIDTGARW